MACRELRYEWFAAVAAELGCQAIAVAHHADDNIETFFLNSLRGSGIAGLAGMKPRNGNIIRPMLGVTRAEVEQYLAALGQTFVVDSTNLENDYKRNIIRNVVVPVVEQEFSGARATLSATVGHVRDYADLFQDLMGDLKQRITSEVNGIFRISIEGLLSVKTERLALLLFDLVKDFNVSFDLCQSIAEIISQNAQNGQHFYTLTHTLSITKQYIVIENRNDSKNSEHFVDFSSLDSLKVKLQTLDSNGIPFSPAMCNGKDVVAFSRGLLSCRKVVLRHWRDGDRMRPFGLKGSKLLSDIFTDAHLSPEARKAVWILEADGKIVWLLGLRAADAFTVIPGSTDYLLIKYCP